MADATEQTWSPAEKAWRIAVIRGAADGLSPVATVIARECFMAGRDSVAASPSEEVEALVKAIKERDEAREAYEMLVEIHYQRVGELVNERDAARAALRTTKEGEDG